MGMQFLTVGEVAERYRRTHRQVRTAIKNGLLPANRPECSRDYRVTAEDAERVFGRVTALPAVPRNAPRETPAARAARQLAQAGVAVEVR